MVVVFGFLLLGLSRARRTENAGCALADYALSGVCGVLVIAAVVLGIYAMANKPKSSKTQAEEVGRRPWLRPDRQHAGR